MDNLEVFWIDFLRYFKEHYPDYISDTVKAYRDYLKDRQELWKDFFSKEEKDKMTQIIEKFFIEDNMYYDIFYQSYYEKYDPLNISPYWPRWFVALYPEAVDFFSNFGRDTEIHGVPPKLAFQYLQDFLRKENIDLGIDSEFSIENLYKLKEVWKKIQKEI